MSETYEVFAEMVETLRQAQGAVRQELEALAQPPGSDGAALARLHEAVRSFNDQAHSLVLMLRNRGMPGELIEIAEELARFFEDAGRGIEAKIKASHE